MGGIVSMLVWGFRKRIERLASPPQRFPVEVIPYHGIRPRTKEWIGPAILLADAALLIYGAASTWETVVTVVCNGKTCTYSPVLTFANALSIVLVAVALFLARYAYALGKDIRRVRTSRVTSNASTIIPSL